MKKKTQVMLCVLVAIVGQIIFTGCNTAHGFGEDMENTGQAIQNKADQ